MPRKNTKEFPDNGLTPAQKNQLFLEHERLVWHIIKTNGFHSDYCEPVDLYQQGCEGLWIAIDRWQPDSGTPLSTYGGTYIKGYIQRYIREKAPVLKLSRSDLDNKAAIYKLSNSEGITIQDAAKALGIKLDAPAIYEPVSTEWEIQDVKDDGITLGDTLGTWDTYFDVEDWDVIQTALDNIRFNSDRDRQMFTEWIYSRYMAHYLGESYPSIDSFSVKYGWSKCYGCRVVAKYKDVFQQNIRNCFFQ